jgi:hypothetical protein
MLVLNPLPEIVRNDATTTAMDRLEADLSKVMSAAGSSRLMLPLARYYPNDDLATLNHLTPSAARTNTLEISAAIREVMKVKNGSDSRH